MNTCEDCTMYYRNPETGELEPIIMRSPGNYDADLVSLETSTVIGDDEESMTQQNTEDETDINKIVDRFTRTGQIQGTNKPAMFGDFTEVPTFQEALDRITEGREAFMRLPAKIRAQFDNNAATWLEAVNEADKVGNKEELKALGIELPPDPPAPETGEKVTEKPVT